MKTSFLWIAPCCSLLACSAPGPAPGLDASGSDSAPGPGPSAVEAPKPIELVDLLYRTRARVAVSSTVANTHDYPEHLIDRRPDTAWNGKTGDLDAHVEVRVPARARVKRLSITVGSDKITRQGDLFTMNRRLTRVAIDRDGERIGVFDLDPEIRTPQAIDLDLPGGTFTLRPLDTVAGTRASYREVVISELVVLGTAPDDELLPPAMPQVTVGSVDGPPSPGGRYAAVIAGGPYRSSSAYCASEMRACRKDLAALKARDPQSDDLASRTAWCRSTRATSKSLTLGAPFTGVELVSADEGQNEVTRLALTTPLGWYPTDVVTSVNYPGPGCGMGGAQIIDSIDVSASHVLVMRITTRAAYCMASPESYEAAGTFLIACALGEGGAPTCRQELVASYDGDCNRFDELRVSGRYDAHPPKWDWQREARVEDDGSIRLSPCVDAKGHEIACSRRNADLLTR